MLDTGKPQERQLRPSDEQYNRRIAEQVQRCIDSKRWDKALQEAGKARGRATQTALGQQIKDAQQAQSQEEPSP